MTLPALGALAAVLAAGCGSDGGGGSSGTTVFRGNVADQTAWNRPESAPSLVRVVWVGLLSPLGLAHAQVSGVEVCIEGTAFCTTTDENGSFVLQADVSGIVTLTFTGPSFTATLTLEDVTAGSTITLEEIRCSVTTGVCAADRIDVEEPSEPSEPSDPSEPSEPSGPSEPSEPSAPSEPSDPSDVSTPSDPSEPSDVSTPSEPSDTEILDPPLVSALRPSP